MRVCEQVCVSGRVSICVETVTPHDHYYRPFTKYLFICSLLHLFLCSLSISLDIPLPKEYPLATRSVLHFPQMAPRTLAGPPHLKKLCSLLEWDGESVLWLAPAVWWNKVKV